MVNLTGGKEEWVTRTRAEGKEKFLTVKVLLLTLKLGLLAVEVGDRDGGYEAEWKARSIAAETGQSILCFIQHDTTQNNVNSESQMKNELNWLPFAWFY